MLYTIFIKKNEKDNHNELVKIIKSYYSKNVDTFILGWPGYIGVNSTSLDSFYDIFWKINSKTKGFFFQPLNEKIIHNKVSNIDYLNNKFGGYYLNQTKLKDHSKILTFLKLDTNYSGIKIEEKIKREFFSVDCLIIGSSNQSYNTYCKSPAQKGEMDVCMIELSSDKELIYLLNSAEINKDDVIVSKEMNDITRTSLKHIVSTILRQTLK